MGKKRQSMQPRSAFGGAWVWAVSRDPGAWGAMLFGLLWYIWRVDAAVAGPSTLWPTHVAWVLHPDWDQHYLGWAFYRQVLWAWPPSRLANLGVPGTGTTVGLMDANPWLCNLLRLVSDWLPTDLQFNGPWMLMCFGLQGWFGAKLVGHYTPSAWGRALGGALLASSPILLARITHDTLTAHWLLLLGILSILLPAEAVTHGGRRPWLWSSAAVIFAAGLHPYLLLMLAPLWIICLGRWLAPRKHCLSLAGAVAYGLAVACWVPLCLYCAGFWGTEAAPQEPGFGVHSANLLSLIDPRGWSRLWPNLPAWPGQSEGFGFLGIGILFCVALASLATATRRISLTWRSPWWLLLGVVILQAAFALSDRIFFGHTLLVNLTAYTLPYHSILSILRASGRFVWPLHYAISAGAIVAVFCAWRTRTANLLVAAALILQVSDSRGEQVIALRQGARVAELHNPLWSNLSGYSHLVLYPPSYQAHENDCGFLAYPDGTYVPLAQQAYAHGLSFNSVSAARTPRQAVAAYCQRLHAEIVAAHFAADTVYIVHPHHIELFAKHPEAVACRLADNMFICVSATKATPLLAHLRRWQQAP